jgi:hypothetical protein
MVAKPTAAIDLPMKALAWETKTATPARATRCANRTHIQTQSHRHLARVGK